MDDAQGPRRETIVRVFSLRAKPFWRWTAILRGPQECHPCWLCRSARPCRRAGSRLGRRRLGLARAARAGRFATGIRALRSLGVARASPSWLCSAYNAGSTTRTTPRGSFKEPIHSLDRLQSASRSRAAASAAGHAVTWQPVPSSKPASGVVRGRISRCQCQRSATGPASCHGASWSHQL